MLGARNAALTFQERDGCPEVRSCRAFRDRGHTHEETTANGGYDDLNAQESRHSSEDGTALVVDGMDTDDVNGRARSEQDRGANGLEQVELAACLWRD